MMIPRTFSSYMGRPLGPAALSLALLFLIQFGGTARASKAAEVSFRTGDGVTVRGRFHPSAGGATGPAVVALHAWLGDREEWTSAAEVLTKRGIGVLAIDLRGHGRTRGGDLRERVLSGDPGVVADMKKDVSAAVRFLTGRGYDPGRIGLLGAGLGAGVALARAAEDSGIHCVALLTPKLDQPGLDLEAAALAFGSRPALVFSGKDDVHKGAEQLGRALGNVVVRTFKARNAYGSILLEKEPDALPLLSGWLALRLAGDVKLDGRLTGAEGGGKLLAVGAGDARLFSRTLPDHLYLALEGGGDDPRITLRVGEDGYVFSREGVLHVTPRGSRLLPLPSGVVRAVSDDGFLEVLLRAGTFGLPVLGEPEIDVRSPAGKATIRLRFGELGSSR